MHGRYSRVTIENVERGQTNRTWKGVYPTDHIDALDYMVDEKFQGSSAEVLLDDVYAIFSASWLRQESPIDSVAVDNLYGESLTKLKKCLIPGELRVTNAGRMTFFQWNKEKNR